jgi:thioredoxin-related protein
MIKKMRKRTVNIIALVLITIVISTGVAGASVRKAIPFEAYSLKGENIDVDFEKEFTLLLFISSECLECLYRLLELKDSVQLLQLEGEVRVLPVCFDCDWRKLVQLTQAVNSEMFLVPEDLKAKWGVWETPTCFLVDPAARVLGKWEGEVPFAEIEKAIATYSRDKRNMVASRKNTSSSCSSSFCY